MAGGRAGRGTGSLFLLTVVAMLAAACRSECRGADGDHRTGDRRRRDHCHRHRDGQSGRRRDDVVRRVRDEHELRLEDGVDERRLGHAQHRGLRVARRASPRAPPTTTASSRRRLPARAAAATACSPRSLPRESSPGSASSVGVSSATLNGTVDPNARPTTWWFEYGTSTSLRLADARQERRQRQRARRTSPPDHAACRRASTYHYRLVATSDGGTTHGADATFRHELGAVAS